MFCGGDTTFLTTDGCFGDTTTFLTTDGCFGGDTTFLTTFLTTEVFLVKELVLSFFFQ